MILELVVMASVTSSVLTGQSFSHAWSGFAYFTIEGMALV